MTRAKLEALLAKAVAALARKQAAAGLRKTIASRAAEDAAWQRVRALRRQLAEFGEEAAND